MSTPTRLASTTAAASAATASTTAFSLGCSTIINERQQAKMAGALDRLRERALMFCADTSAAARFDFSKVRNELAQERHVLVINVDDPCFADRVHLPARESSSTSSSSTTHRYTFLSLILHPAFVPGSMY
ncbi:hypothetical protein BH23CHL2_BH23CHL2_10180 [soil metagenome]